MKDFFKKLFHKHKHEYVKIGFEQKEDRVSRYSVREYECRICGKTKKVDGRFDTTRDYGGM